jgi:predicted ester cyclase
MAEDNVSLVKRWFIEVWNQNKPQTARELLAPECVMHGITETGADVHGPEEFLKLHAALLGAFPDMQFELHECFGAGDLVTIRWTATMHHHGHGLGIDPTGAQIRLNGIGIAKIHNGKVVETWDNWDRMAMFEQLDAAAKAKTAQV